jgi:hypothetical protein
LVPGENDTIEQTYVFATTPQPGANQKPIYRCARSKNLFDDYPSRSETCEGSGTLVSFLGYSHAPTKAGAAPVYRCRRGSGDTLDHYLARNPDCGGNTLESTIGYALSQ